MKRPVARWRDYWDSTSLRSVSRGVWEHLIDFCLFLLVSPALILLYVAFWSSNGRAVDLLLTKKWFTRLLDRVVRWLKS